MSDTFRDRLADFLRAHADRWIDGRQLAQIAGAYAWRTRLSDCRLQLGMAIENRVRREGHVKVSEYRYVPPAPVQAQLFVEP